MGQRAEVLAARFREVNEEFARVAEGCSAEQWRACTAAEGWSVGVTAHHVAYDQEIIAAWLLAALTPDGAPPLVTDSIHEENARHAAEHAGCAVAETVALLHAGSGRLVDAIRTLPDEALDREVAPFAGRPPLTLGRSVERILIGHLHGHLTSIRETLERAQG